MPNCYLWRPNGPPSIAQLAERSTVVDTWIIEWPPVRFRFEGAAAILLPPPSQPAPLYTSKHQPEPKIPYAMYPCGASARATICIWGGFDSGVDEKMKEGKQVPWYMRACNTRRGAQLLSRAHLWLLRRSLGCPRAPHVSPWSASVELLVRHAAEIIGLLVGTACCTLVLVELGLVELVENDRTRRTRAQHGFLCDHDGAFIHFVERFIA